MFKIGEYEVYFKHYPEEVGTTEIGDNAKRLPYCGKTLCVITQKDEAIRDGYAYCSVNDRFDKSTGRKVALNRALEGAKKDFRALIWKKYLEVSRKKT
jgi:hypothetical protein